MEAREINPLTSRNRVDALLGAMRALGIDAIDMLDMVAFERAELIRARVHRAYRSFQEQQHLATAPCKTEIKEIRRHALNLCNLAVTVRERFKQGVEDHDRIAMMHDAMAGITFASNHKPLTLRELNKLGIGYW